MTNPNLRILSIETAISEEPHETQWTETPSRGNSSVVFSLEPQESRTPKMITVQVKDVIDAMVGRMAVRPLWLSDFHDDPISITEDMFEVLVAYRTLRRAA
jgi:hypothetical protein